MPTYVYECPVCHARTTCENRDDAPYRPFCSERCKLIDLGRWLNEEYRVTEELPPEVEEESSSRLPEPPPD